MLSESEERQQVAIASFARRFEVVVIVALAAIIGIVTLLALARLVFAIYLTFDDSWNVTDIHVIQILFGMIMTVLISLELGSSILRNLPDTSTVIHAKEIILIGMMAVVRKVMLVDINSVSPWQIAALGVVAIALACAYWLTQDAK